MIVYTCEDTFEAMMTCIYDAWASKEGHQNIRLKTEPSSVSTAPSPLIL